MSINMTQLDHVVLRVNDVAASISFYTAVLGCTVENERPDLGLYQLRSGDFIIDLVDVDSVIGSAGGPGPGADGHNLDHFCVRVAPWDEAAIRDHLANHGIEAGPVADNWGGDGRGPSIYIEDPGGNTVELKGPPTSPFDPDVGYVPSS